MQTFTKQQNRNWLTGYRWIVSAITGILFLLAGTIQAQVTVTNPGNTTPGLLATYTDLASAITDLNAQTAISGPVTISLASGNPQTAPAGGYAITAILSGASSTNTVTIDGGGNTITMPNPAGSSGALTDAVFKFIGADFMTLQNFTMQENPANTTTTAGTNNMTEWGVALLYASATDGAQNITIQNNTISLNRVYQNTFGIYSNSTHTATNVSTTATASSTDGNNSGLKIYGNNISNVNNGIVVVGPTAAANYNTGIDIGGTGVGTGNTITNYGTTSTFSSFANVSGTTNGILVRNSIGFNISYNSITSSVGGVTAGTLHGIHIPAASAAATGTFTNEVSNNSISLKSGVTAGAMIGINFLTNHATATSTTNISNNNFFDTDHTTGTATGSITFITSTGTDQTKNITGNTFTNMSVKTTGTVTFLSHSYTMQSGYSSTVSNNSVVTGFTKTGAGGSVIFSTTSASSVNGSTQIYSNNNFSNISVTGATTLTGITTSDGLSTGSSAKTISGNTFSNWTGGSSTVSGMIVSYFGAGTSTINNNTYSNISGSGTVNGFTFNSSGNLGTQVDIHSNSITGLSSSGGALTGITSSNTSPDINIYNNSISNLSTASNALVTGVLVSGANNTEVYANTICNLSGTAPGSTIDGIRVTATTANGVAGIYNNRIGDFSTPDAVGANVINGIDITTSTATVTVNVYFNTVYLNASSTGVDFGTSALFSNTGSTLNLINNALINNSTANGTGLSVAFRRSSATLTSYGAASNNNLLYAGTPSASNLIFFDGTNSDQLINDFKLRVAPRDGNSNSENPPFLSTACGNSNFLKVNTAIATLMESTGTPISGITTDFEGDSRNGTTPDVGADEFAGTAASVVAINSVSASPGAALLCTAAARTITANITVGGTNLVSAQVFYTINGVIQTPINMTGGNPNAGQTSNWTAVIPVPTPANASISWSVAAADAITSKVEAGTTYQDEPLLGASGVATASAASVCAGADVTLTADLIAGGSVVPVGAGSTTDASYLAPFYSAWSNKHEQILIRADELTAAGLYPGAITEISFPTTSGTISPLDFTVKLGHTTQTDMTSFVTTGLTQVYFNATQPQVANTNNTLVLNTPFVWDGTSNLVVDICFGNPGSTATLSSTSPSDVTPYVSVIKTHTSAATSSAVACADITTNVAVYSERPRILFKGVGIVTPDNISWSDGVNTIGSGSPLNYALLEDKTFTATFTLSGCTINSNPVSVDTIGLANGPIVAPSSQCGEAVPTCFAVGTNDGNYRWYLQAVGGTPIPGEVNGTLSSYSISTTTTFYVAINDGGPCESARTPVTATVVAPDPIQALSSSASVCVNSSVDLSVQQTGSNQTYVYTWTASPEAGSGITGSVNGSPVSITPTQPGTYTYTVVAVDDNGTPATSDDCTISSQVQVVVNALPVILSTTATPSTVCAGAPVVLEALTGSFAPGVVSIGTQTTTIGGSDGNPYRAGNGAGNEVRTQLLFTAAELQSAGLTAGDISELAFFVTSISGGATVNNFNISIAHTTASTLSTTFEASGFVNVLSLPSYTAVSGWNTHTFTTPFVWDGTSNIAVNVCQLNVSGGGTVTVGVYNPGFAANTHRASSTTSCTTATGTAIANRPIVQLTGITGSSGPGTLTWSWDNGGGSGNQVTVNPLSTTTYTVTGIDPVTTCSNTASVLVTVNPIPADPTATGSEQCGTAIPTANVASNSGDPSPTFNWYDAPTGGNLLQSDPSTTYLSVIGTTTTFYVSELSSFGCEGNRVAVTVTVQEPDAITASVSSASVCLGSGFTISSSYTPDFNNYTAYSLTALPEAGSGVTGSVSLVANGTGSDPYSITPTAVGTYQYVISAQDPDKGCEITDTIEVTVVALPVVSAVTATPSTICAGQSSTLEATSLTGSPLPFKIGTGTTGFTGAANPYWRSGESSKGQNLYLASDLIAAGMTAGPINAISFFVTSTPAAGLFLDQFTISLAHTSLTALSLPPITTGMQQVYGPVYYEIVAGTNTHTFDVPFVWDGVSNIIVQTCYNNDPTGTCSTCSGSTPAVEYTSSVGYTAASYIYGSNSATSGWDFCETLVSPTSSGTQANRPNATFFQGNGNNTAPYNWTWNPGSLSGAIVNVSPSTTTSYSVTATDPLSGCSTTLGPVEVVVNPLPPAPTTNDPVTRCGAGQVTMTATGTGGTLTWYDVPTGGTALFTGGSYTTTVAASTIFYVAETSAQGCEGPRSAVNVTITTAPTLAITPGGPTTYCEGGSVVLDAVTNSSPAYVNFNWTPATGLSASNTGIVTANPTVTTTYTLTVDDGDPITGCANTASITVTVNPNPVPVNVFAEPSTICAGQSTNLILTAGSFAAGQAEIGVESSSMAATTGNPYRSGFASGTNLRLQILLTATELTNAGFGAGNIESLSFLTNGTTAGTFSSYTISMAHTNVSLLTTTFETPTFSTVFSGPFSPVAAGWNTHTFSTPFAWDGTSNIVIDICKVVSSATVTTTVAGSSSGFNSVVQNTSSCVTATGTTGTTRPVLRIAGQIGSNLASTYDVVWTPGPLTGDTVSVSPTSTQTYTATATIGATGCFVTSDPVTVTVNPVPAAPVTNSPVTRCGPGQVTMTATNTGGTMNWYDVPTGGTPLFTGDSYTTVVPGSTTFYVAETYVAGCEGPRTAVTVNITPSPNLVITPAGSTTICEGTSLSLDAAIGSDPSYVNFTWSDSPAGLGGLSTTSGAQVVVTPSSEGTFTYTVSADDGATCSNIATITVTVNPAPVFASITASPANICVGASSNLAAVITGNIPSVDSLGTQTTTMSGVIGNPYRSSTVNNQVKSQFLVRASELTAAGYLPGNISSLAFRATVAGVTMQNFEIRIGNTAANVMTSTFLTDPLTTVFTQSVLSPSVGINTHTFTTPFNWDGTSNVLIETRQIVAVLGTTTVAANAPGFTSVVAVSSTTGFAATTGTTSTTNRPLLIIGGIQLGNDSDNYNWVWNPGGLVGDSVTVSPTVTTQYTVTATNQITNCSYDSVITVNVIPVAANATASPTTPVCAGSAVELNAGGTGGEPLTYSWSDGTNVVGTAATITVNPTVTTTYTVTVTDNCNASTTSSVTVNVIALPTASIVETSPINICDPATQTLTVSTNAVSATYQWLLNNTPISGATNPTLNISGISSGSYSVIVTNTETTCISDTSDPVLVNINPTPNALSISPASAAICAGSPQVLTASGGIVLTNTTGVITGTSPTTTTGSQSPFYRTFEGAKHQYLISVAELTALGMTAGSSMNSVSFNVTALSRTTNINHDNFVVKTGLTTQSNLTSAFVTTGMNTVYGPVVYNPVLGANNFAFNTPLVWDGTSNVVIEICYDNDPDNTCTAGSPVCWSNAATVSSATGPTGSSRNQYQDNSTGPRTFCDLPAGTIATTTSRPVMTFGITVFNQAPVTWSPSTGLNTTTGLTVTASPEVTTTYTATATTAEGCSSSAQVTITTTPRPTGALSGTDIAYCEGSVLPTTLSIAVTGTGPWSGTLSDGSTFSGSVSPIVVNVTPSVTTTYSIATLTDANCASVAGDLSGSVTVTVNPLATTPVVSVTQPTCSVATGTLTITSPVGSGIQYSLDGGPFQSSPVFSGVAPGPHSVDVLSDAGCGSTGAASVTVNPQPFIPAPPTVTGTVNVCAFIGTSEQVTYTATAAGATSYTWTLPPNVTLISGAGTSTITVTFQTGFATQANKQLRVRASSICGTSAQTIYYLAAQLPNTPAPITGPTSACAYLDGTPVVYSVPAAAGAASYIWTAQPGVNITPAGPGAAGNSVTVVFPPTFTTSAITVQAVNDCGVSGVRSITVTRANPSTPSLIAGPTNVCEFIAPNGTAATYTVPLQPGVTTYTWTLPAGALNVTGQGTNSISFIYPAGYTGGSISVIASNGCGSSAVPRTLTVSTLSPATPSVIDVINTVSCPNREYTYSIASLPANATSVQWTIPAGATLVSGQGTTSITVSYPSTAIAGTVSAVAVNNCGTSVARNVDVKLPACPDPEFAKGVIVTPTPTKQVDQMEVSVFPNPSVSDFKLQVRSKSNELIHVRVLDMTGREYKLHQMMPNETLSLGATLKAGAYILEIRQGKELKTTKVLKF